MDRRAALIAIVATAALSVAAWGKQKSASSSSSKPELKLLSIDRAQRLIRVEVTGFKKPPPGNFFSMTDELGRHYIAQSVRCTPPGGPALTCGLEIPDGYERHALVSLELHTRGLHSRTIAVPKDEVAAVWQAALTPRPDGGAPDPAAP